MASFGNGVFADMAELMWGHQGGPYPGVTGVLVKRGDLDTDMHTRRRPSGDKGRGGAMRPQAKECRRQPAKHRKLNERDGAGRLAASEGARPADTLALAFLSVLQSVRQSWLLFEPPSVWWFVTATTGSQHSHERRRRDERET